MCTHNRATMLRDAIASLVSQQTEGKFTFELLIVHSGAAETIRVIEDARKAGPVPVRAAFQEHRGISVARNRALAEARGEWFAWFDDDQLADPTWLKALLDIAIEKNCQSTGGVRLLKLPENCNRHLTKACRRALGESEIWPEARPYNPKEGPPGGSHLLHRSIVEKVGNYDEAFGLRGEDTDLYRRICKLGIVSWYTPLSICHHIIPPDRLTRGIFSNHGAPRRLGLRPARSPKEGGRHDGGRRHCENRTSGLHQHAAAGESPAGGRPGIDPRRRNSTVDRGRLYPLEPLLACTEFLPPNTVLFSLRISPGTPVPASGITGLPRVFPQLPNLAALLPKNRTGIFPNLKRQEKFLRPPTDGWAN